jgi:hypothetical protein
MQIAIIRAAKTQKEHATMQPKLPPLPKQQRCRLEVFPSASTTLVCDSRHNLMPFQTAMKIPKARKREKKKQKKKTKKKRLLVFPSYRKPLLLARQKDP